MSKFQKTSFMSWVLEEVMAEVRDMNRKQIKSTRRLEDKLSALTDAVVDLKGAVAGVAERVDAKVAPLVAALDTVTNQLAAERQAASDLAAAEDAEDVAQNQALADAQAATDASLAEAAAAAEEIRSEVTELNTIAATETPAEEPVDETPVEPAPEEPVVEEPVVEPAPVEPAPEDPAAIEPAPEQPVDDQVTPGENA